MTKFKVSPGVEGSYWSCLLINKNDNYYIILIQTQIKDKTIFLPEANITSLQIQRIPSLLAHQMLFLNKLQVSQV